MPAADTLMFLCVAIVSSTDPQALQPTEEIAANVRDYVAANFGTWSVNERTRHSAVIMMVLSIPTTTGPRTRLL